MSLYKKGRKAFEKIIGEGGEDTVAALYNLFIAAFIVVVLVFAFNIVFGRNLKLGEWGDFLGGVLNPLLTFLTFTGLLITIVLQRSELVESRKEFKRSADALQDQHLVIRRQIFETTFFQMLVLYNSIVNSIRTKDKKGEIREGRDCFSIFYTEISDEYKERKEKVGAPYSGDELATIQYSYRAFVNTRRRDLGHYFRYLYNILRFIDESEYRNGPYVRLVRSQFGDQEALVLFYNCLTQNGTKFKALAERFALFDNIDRQWLLDSSHVDLISSLAFDSASSEAIPTPEP